MEIDSKIAVAISPAVMLIVNLITATVKLPDNYRPIICLGVATVVMATYIISTTGFVVANIYDYLIAAVASASIASGLYSWGKTIQPNNNTNTSTPVKEPVINNSIITTP